MSTLKRWETGDHTSGGYWDPHVASECKECRRHGNDGDWYRVEDVDAEIERLKARIAELEGRS